LPNSARGCLAKDPRHKLTRSRLLAFWWAFFNELSAPFYKMLCFPLSLSLTHTHTHLALFQIIFDFHQIIRKPNIFPYFALFPPFDPFHSLSIRWSVLPPPPPPLCLSALSLPKPRL
jgi:hypothetical protein